MKNLIYVASIIIGFSFSSCGNKAVEHENETVETKNLALALDKDPVCGMSVKGNAADTTSYNGKIYGFCSPGCKEEFKKNPAQYLKE